MGDPTYDKSEAVGPILELVRQIHTNQVALSKKLTDHTTVQAQEISAAIAKLVKESFPEGDPAGHRKHHEAVIKAAEDRAKFWRTMLIEITKGGLLGLLAWVAISMWQAFLKGPST